MSGRSILTPKYRRHKRSGNAVVTLPDGMGGRKDVYLGKWRSKESRAEYDRVIAEWAASGRRLPSTAGHADQSLTINGLILAFITHAEQHYRRADGSKTNELADYKRTLKPLKALYGTTPAIKFGPLALEALRLKMIHGEPPCDRKLTRGVINQRIGRIKRMFRWGVSKEIVPETVYNALETLAGLQRGRSDARETQRILPVPAAFVEAVLPCVVPQVAAMIKLQLLTGMRPGEVCDMRPVDIDMSGQVWLYRPEQHKTAWRGRERVIALGPKAQAIVREFLPMNTHAPLFSPKRALADRAAELRAARQNKVQPSQHGRRNQRKGQPKRIAGEWYKVTSYGRAIVRGCEIASRKRACDACRDRHEAEIAARKSASRLRFVAGGRLEQEKPRGDDWRPWETCDRCRANMIPAWYPNRLRHSFATDIRRRFGLEAAQVTLGHSQANVTQIYAEADLSLAERVAAEVG